MSEASSKSLPTVPVPPFPWKHVLITAVITLLVVGFIILIRRAPSVAIAAAGPAVALGASAIIQKTESRTARTKQKIDMEFLKAHLREGASEKVVLTPTELKLALNRLFEQNNFAPPFESEQHMAKVLSPLGLRSKVRSVQGRSERRWYELSDFGGHEIPAQ